MPEDVSGDSGPATATEPEPSRWKRYEATLRTRAESAWADAEERRQRSRFYDTILRIYERNRLLPASLLVGALASRIVIYLIPLLALLIFVLGLYQDAGGAGAEAASSIAEVFAVAVEDSRDVNEGFRFLTVVATLFATLYAANSLGRLVRRSTALVWGVRYVRSSKPWMPLVGVLAISAVGWIVSSMGSWSSDWTWELTVGVMAVEFVFLVVLWVLVSRVLPHDPAATRWSNFVPGAIFLAVGVLGMRVAMVVYLVPQSADLSQRYGSIGVALVMLTWAYWLGLIIIGASELNTALFQGSSKGRRPVETGRDA